jgi:hypothetical protein
MRSVTIIDQQLSALEKIEQRKKPKTAGTRYKKRKSRKRRH